MNLKQASQLCKTFPSKTPGIKKIKELIETILNVFVDEYILPEVC